MMTESDPRIDHAALRTNQAVIIGLNLAAFITDQVWLAALVSIVMAIGTAWKKPGFGILYQRILKPRGWVKSELVRDNPEPHRFAQGFGAAVMILAVICLYAGFSLPGWALIWLVIALASLNLFAGFCLGCAVYYWFNRLRVPGFHQSPPMGSFPGMRPRPGNQPPEQPLVPPNEVRDVS